MLEMGEGIHVPAKLDTENQVLHVLITMSAIITLTGVLTIAIIHRGHTVAVVEQVTT